MVLTRTPEKSVLVSLKNPYPGIMYPWENSWVGDTRVGIFGSTSRDTGKSTLGLPLQLPIGTSLSLSLPDPDSGVWEHQVGEKHSSRSVLMMLGK